MPEKGVVKLFEREILWEERQVPVSVDRADDNAFMGEFVANPDCCARVNGTRQTFTVHVSSSHDPRFVQLPCLPPPPSGKKPPAKKSSKKGEDKKDPPPFYCPSCHGAHSEESTTVSNNPIEKPEPLNNFSSKSVESVAEKTVRAPDIGNIPTAEFVNTLNITGRISAKARGKELIIAICNRKTGKNFVFRLNFALEGHCFWIPTEWYHNIVAQEPVHRGVKSHAYPIPDEYVDGPATGCIISIQAAFIPAELLLQRLLLPFNPHHIRVELDVY
ncbi:hypothetical protein B0H10DRAFT_2198735 [Mycena sp. CBHHK59/15]|nr:hypothetical protein B0H10DRAFT_2198735 [Mycena sp. CBHHK59/15]